MDEHDRAQIDATVDLLRRLIDDDLLAVYLHGSAVSGGLRPRSDLDLLVVIQRPLTAETRRALIAGLLRLSGRGDPSGRSRSLEVSVVVGSEVRPWRFPPRLELQYGDWWRSELTSGVEAPWREFDPDLAVLVTTVRSDGVPLVGPPPADLLDPVPPGDVVHACLDGIPDLLADLEDDTTNVLLTLARIWVTVATGRIVGKDTAASWAAARLPARERALLARARAAYLGEDEPRWQDVRPELPSLARDLVARIVADVAPEPDPRAERVGGPDGLAEGR